MKEILSLLAILHGKKGDYKEAEKFLSPLLQSDTKMALTAYEEVLILQFPNNSQEPELQRLSQAESYLAKHNDNIAVVHFLSSLCLKAEVWGKARNYLTAIPSNKYNVHHCHLMAELEQAENGNAAAAKAWLERSESL